MGGIVIDIWVKSNFFGSFGSQRGPKNAIFVQGALKAPLMVGLTLFFENRKLEYLEIENI